MADKPKKVVRLGGGTRTGIEVATQTKNDNRLSVHGEPTVGADPTHWAAWIQEAQGEAIESVIELGRRLWLARAAHGQEPQRWGRRWEDWCEEFLGIKRSFAFKLVSIWDGLGEENLFRGVKHVLPADTEVLYGLARLRKEKPDAFDVEVEAGTIKPDLNRAGISNLLDRYYPDRVAKREARKPSARSLRVDAGIAELLEQRANARGQTISELLMEFLQAP